jgi:shikimate kinase
VRQRSESEIAQRQVVLIGMMGTGKTTVGRLLAARLGRAFWDNDEALEAATGRTAAEYQREHGPAALHQTEDRLLREALRTETPTVFAAAAAVVLHPGVLSGTVTVWLRARPEWEARNIARSGEQHRPLPADAGAFLERLSAERLALYTGAAEITVDVAAQPAATCDRVLEALSAFTQSA